MIDRPTFNYDNQGRDLSVPAAPAPTDVVNEIATQDAPSDATSRALTPATAPAVTPVRDADGKIIRPDWSLPTTEVKAKSLPTTEVKVDQTSELDKPRNERGQWVGKVEGDLIEQWKREGNYDQNVARVKEAETTMFAASEDPEKLAQIINTLPREIALKAADHLRLTSAPGKGYLKFDQFMNSLTETEYQTLRSWAKYRLAESDTLAIFEAFIK